MRPATVRRLLGLAAIVVMLAIMLVPTLRRYLEQRDQIATLEHSIVEQQRQVDDLMRERAKWDDQAFLEQQIRSRLHFVKPGETSYTVLDPQTGRRTSVDAQVVGVDLEAGTITIGLLSDLTGPFSPLVQIINTGHDLYWASVNEAGGVNGLNVELDSIDNQDEPPALAAE